MKGSLLLYVCFKVCQQEGSEPLCHFCFHPLNSFIYLTIKKDPTAKLSPMSLRLCLDFALWHVL